MPQMIILQGDRLKGRKSPVIWVEYLPEGSKIGYMVPWLGDGLEIEELCDLLGELVEKYHPGLGQKAFEAAREQLETRDYAEQWAKMKAQQAAYKRWGGHPPAAVLQPDETDPKAAWNLVVPQNEGLGELLVYKVDPRFTKDLPRPEEGKNAYRDNFGFKAIPSKQEAVRRRWNRARSQALFRGMKERRVEW